MSQAISIISKSRKSVLLGTSALVCLALAAPVMADDFVIIGSDGSTNGNIDANAINGSDTVTLGIALTATGTNKGTAGSFTDNSRGSIYRSVTVGFDYAGSESMTLSGAVEAFSSTGGASGNSASLSANWSF
jgi:hypothetical protein